MLQPKQFRRMYHASSPANRHGIQQEGLRADYAEGPPGVYMSPQPSPYEHEDVWEVNTHGLPLEPDDGENMHEFQDVGGSWWSPESVPVERVRLYREGKRHG